MAIAIAGVALDSGASNAKSPEVGAADLAGAIVGGLFGGPVGAIVGAISASLTAALHEGKSVSEKIGIYHNMALDLYFNSNSKPVDIDYTTIRDEIIKLLVDYDSETFNKDEINNFVIKSEKILSVLKIDISFKNAKSVYNNFSQIIDYLERENEISSLLGKELSIINNEVFRGDITPKEILNKVNSLNSIKWSKRDARYVNSFTQVYSSSYSYWIGSDSNTERDGNDVILADAAGGLYGLLLGPVGSILYGAVFSLVANNRR